MAAHKEEYLRFLNEDLESKDYEAGAILTALVLMGNHAHEIFHVLKQALFSAHMRRHHSRYGSYFNRKKGRCGKVAQDRPKTCLIGDDHHEMIVTFYIHANPIRAGIVKDARNYFWSTHKLYAFGKREDWMRNVVLPRWYKALGKNDEQRQKKYRSLFALYLKEEEEGEKKKKLPLHKVYFGPLAGARVIERRIQKWRDSRKAANTS